MFGVWGLGFRAKGLRFVVQGLVFRVSSFGCRAPERRTCPGRAASRTPPALGLRVYADCLLSPMHHSGTGSDLQSREGMGAAIMAEALHIKPCPEMDLLHFRG